MNDATTPASARLPLRVFHDYQNFLSHARCARDYRRLLEKICTVTDDPDAADIAILHHEPSFYPTFVYDVPALRDVYRIGYCVWEADTVPYVMQQGLDMMHELWTASAYCYEVFSRHHPNVRWIPHVVNVPVVVSDEDRAMVDNLIGRDPAHFNVLTITQESILRKNTQSLRTAFARVAQACPGARLVIKTTPPEGEADTVQVQTDGAVVNIHGRLPRGALYALYERCQAYASAHCSEGWGLPMSDAMVLGCAVIGTNYSGNVDFMTPCNSFLVEASELPIRKRDLYYMFKEGMRWAYVHRESLEEQLMRAYRMWHEGTLAEKTAQAKADIACYDDAHVEALMRQRLTDLCARVAP